MADNVEANAGSGGAVFATDDAAGVHHPYVKVEFGADDTQTPVSAANPLPVVQTGTHTVTGTGGTFPVTDSGGSLTVDGAVTANAGTNLNTSALALEAGGNLEAAAASLATLDNIVSGSEAQVDIVTMPNVTLAAGTNTNEVVGDAAHDAAIAGNPVRIGARALSADYAAVAAGDAADLITSLLGKLVTLPFALPGATWSYASPAAVTDTSDDEAKAAGAAGVRHYITSCQVFNSDDTVGTEVVIKDGSTVLWRGWCEQTGGGAAAVFNPPLRGTAATAVNVANITTSAETYFNLQGFSASE